MQHVRALTPLQKGSGRNKLRPSLLFEMGELSDISEDDEDGKERRLILMEQRRQALDKRAG